MKISDLGECEQLARYDNMLDAVYGTVQIAGGEYNTSRALIVLDTVAYRCGFSDWLSSEEYNENELGD